jgi:hypothetical protein
MGLAFTSAIGGSFGREHVLRKDAHKPGRSVHPVAVFTTQKDDSLTTCVQLAGSHLPPRTPPLTTDRIAVHHTGACIRRTEQTTYGAPRAAPALTGRRHAPQAGAHGRAPIVRQPPCIHRPGGRDTGSRGSRGRAGERAIEGQRAP